MTLSEPVKSALQEWIEIFMKHSMKNFIAFSKESKFSMSQVGAMFHIYRKGSSGVSNIGDELGVTSAAASQLLERMVQEGLILRSEDPHDRRLKQIILTNKGRDFLQEVMRARMSWLNELTEILSPTEQEKVLEVMTLLVDKSKQLDRQVENTQ